MESREKIGKSEAMEHKKKDGPPCEPDVKPLDPQGTGSREPAWTPGPWSVEVMADGIFVSTWDHVALFWFDPDASLLPGEGEQALADLTLAAAAPELYEALREFMETPGNCITPERYPKSRAALAKARGEAVPAIQSPETQQEPPAGSQGGQK